MNKLKVSTRLYLGFAAVVLLGLGLAVFGIIQFATVQYQVDRLGRIAGNVQRVLKTAHDVEAIRRTEVRYRLDGSATAVQERSDSLAQAKALLTEAARLTLSDERRRMYNSINDALAAHDETFARLLQLSGTANDARARLFTGGDELTAAANRLVEAARATHQQAAADAAANVESAVQLVRIANWRFLATNDPTGPATFRAKVEAASAAVSKLEQLADPENWSLWRPSRTRSTATRRISAASPRPTCRLPACLKRS